eukprot:TRINITY_DN3233_c3_g11_i1.p1 TRINITY_DN3233_c3_g11~~TRINITY_DN3233_c3_g11_i1.p1  ORF type:complete len:79 (+),score=7.35 TRINITY_DN3233_c3_g11_i1:103-339(+)
MDSNFQPKNSCAGVNENDIVCLVNGFRGPIDPLKLSIFSKRKLKLQNFALLNAKNRVTYFKLSCFAVLAEFQLLYCFF